MTAAHRPWMSLDVEASGVLPEYALQPWRFRQRKAWLTTAAIALRPPGGGEIAARGKTFPKPDDLRMMLRFATNNGYRIVTWNGCYDLAWLIAYGLRDEVFAARWIDGMHLWKHLDMTSSFSTAEHGYGLKGERGAIGTFAPEMLGYDDDVEYHTQDPAKLAKLLEYNKDDNRGTLISAEAIWDRLSRERRQAALIEARSLPMVAEANLNGMVIDKKGVLKVAGLMKKQAAEMAADLLQYGITEKVVRSPKQLSAVMFDEWGLPDIAKRSTAKEVLVELAPLDERVNKTRKFRDALNLFGKFVGGIASSVEYNGTGNSYPQAKMYGTYTGRMTYASTQDRRAKSGDDEGGGKATGKNRLQIGFALHQMKRDKDFRNMVTAPEGHLIVEFDAAGQEFKFMAIASGDETMLQLCQPGEDAHSFMGGKISGIEYRTLMARVKAEETAAKKIRTGGKVGNFSLQYRTSPPTFRIRALADHDMRISIQESEHICRVYKQTYPGVPTYWRRQIQRGRMLGYAETLAGRCVAVKGNWFGDNAWAMEGTMINFPVQGTGGDQKYLALSIIIDVLNDYDAKFAWDMHDGLYFYVPKDKALAFAHAIRTKLDNLPYRKAWGWDPPIPLPWDCKIGPSWGSLKDLEAA